MQSVTKREFIQKCRVNIALLFSSLVLIAALFIIDLFDYSYGFLLFFTRFCLYVVILYNLFSILRALGKWPKTMAALKKLILIGAALWLATFLFAMGLVVANSGSDELDNPRYVVVEGAGLVGEKPSLILKGRLDAALEILNRYPDCKAVLCGRQAPDEVISEAEAMYRYLTAAGIDGQRLIKEEESRDTAENIANAKALILTDSGGAPGEVVISTSGFHMFRSKLLADKHGLDALGVTSCNSIKYFRFYLREYFSLGIFLVELTGITIDTSWLVGF